VYLIRLHLSPGATVTVKYGKKMRVITLTSDIECTERGRCSQVQHPVPGDEEPILEVSGTHAQRSIRNKECTKEERGGRDE